ncbi:MAG: polysaccharide deacetylase family protein [Bacilli bacterium]|nr:polysaccharide deacetylase family protein [Bacilli bacterium]
MLKKKRFLLIPLFFIFIFLYIHFSEKKENDVITMVRNNKNTMIAINYPKTKDAHLNKKIENQVSSAYQNFIEQYEDFKSLEGKAEFNVDYEYHEIDDTFLSITLYYYVDSHTLETPTREITSFLYNQTSHEYFTLNQITKNTKELTSYINQTLKEKYGTYVKRTYKEEEINTFSFTVDTKKIALYIPSHLPQFSYYVVHIPFEYFKINKPKEITSAFQYIPKDKVIQPREKVIALTFDDGPSRNTKNIVKVLNKYNVNATFFILGNKVSLYKSDLQNLLNSGNQIGNHSYNHKLMSTLEDSDLEEQIKKTQEVLEKELGYTATVLRPTYGSVSKKMAEKTSLSIVLWNVDTLDWKIKDPKKIAKRGMAVRDGSIILMHDSKDRSVKALEIMIPKLLKKGYQFVTIDELKEVQMIRKKL